MLKMSRANIISREKYKFYITFIFYTLLNFCPMFGNNLIIDNLDGHMCIYTIVKLLVFALNKCMRILRSA